MPVTGKKNILVNEHDDLTKTTKKVSYYTQSGIYNVLPNIKDSWSLNVKMPPIQQRIGKITRTKGNGTGKESNLCGVVIDSSGVEKVQIDQV